jgi:hypothetical protein
MTAGAEQVRGTASYAKLPLSFEPCFEAMCAEAGSQAKYFSRGSGYVLFLASTETVLDAGPSKKSALRMKLLRSNSKASIEAMDPLPGKSNYFIGKNPKSWRSNVTNYAKVKYRNVYPGVDLVYYGNGSQLEYDFVVAAGGRKPRVWQQAGGTKKEVAARYAIRNKNEVGFELDHYDAGAALVIDPVLVYTTFLDGFNSAAGAVDGAGNVYLNVSNGGRGMLVKKLDRAGTVIYSTYIGGASPCGAIALDAQGNAYVTGFANTPDFPATPGAFQTQIVGTGAPFIAKVNDTGTALAYATFLSPSDGASLTEDFQGPPFTSPCCIAVDSAGSAYVTGTTRSKNFPTTPGAFQPHWDASETAGASRRCERVLTSARRAGAINAEGDAGGEIGPSVVRSVLANCGAAEKPRVLLAPRAHSTSESSASRPAVGESCGRRREFGSGVVTRAPPGNTRAFDAGGARPHRAITGRSPTLRLMSVKRHGPIARLYRGRKRRRRDAGAVSRLFGAGDAVAGREPTWAIGRVRGGRHGRRAAPGGRGSARSAAGASRHREPIA